MKSSELRKSISVQNYDEKTVEKYWKKKTYKTLMIFLDFYKFVIKCLMKVGSQLFRILSIYYKLKDVIFSLIWKILQFEVRCAVKIVYTKIVYKTLIILLAFKKIGYNVQWTFVHDLLK